MEEVGCAPTLPTRGPTVTGANGMDGTDGMGEKNKKRIEFAEVSLFTVDISY